MDLVHQLTPMLKSLRLSGILETMEVRNRLAIESKLSYVECPARCGSAPAPRGSTSPS